MTRSGGQARPVRRQCAPQSSLRRLRKFDGWSARGAPGPLARGLARLARRAAGAHHTRQEGLTSPLAPSRRSIPRWGKEKGKTACPAPIKEQGRRSFGFLNPSPERGGWRAERAGWGLSATKNSPHPPLALLAAALPRKRGRDKNLRHLLAPQPRRGDVGALADRSQLEPDRRFDHPFAVRESAESAIGRRDHAFALADRRDRVLDAACHDFGVLDEIAGGLHNAWDQQHVLRQRMFF